MICPKCGKEGEYLKVVQFEYTPKDLLAYVLHREKIQLCNDESIEILGKSCKIFVTSDPQEVSK